MKLNSIYKKFFVVVFFCALLFQWYAFVPLFFYSSDKKIGSIMIYDRHEKKYVDKRFEDGYYIPLSQKNIGDSKFVSSLIHIEDKRYFDHFWIDILSKFRAISQNISSDTIISWWSTITEQFIKNKYFLWDKRNYLQKLREGNIAFFLSIFKTKDEILYEYLDKQYFWNGIYWLEWAMQKYFWKTDIGNLSENEIVILLSLIKYPWIKSFHESHFVEYQKILKKRLWFSYNFEKKVTPQKINIDPYPFITNHFLKKISNFSYTSYNFHSTIDIDLQNYSFEILNSVILSFQEKNVTNGAVIWYDPNNSQILIYHPSRNYTAKNIDGNVDILQSKRQLWSTLKPFLYLQALEQNAEIDSLLVDVESQYNVENSDKIYIWENYSLKEYWLIRLKKALWNSLNASTVKLAKYIWMDNVYNFYKKYWFQFDYSAQHYGYWLVLGNPSIRLYDLVKSYSYLLPDYIIEDFELTLDKNEVYLRKKQWIDTNKYLLYKILQSPDNRDISFWVNSVLNTSLLQAVKTGTSSDFRDNVLISYWPELVLGIWVGNNDNSSMKGVTGITWAWYIYNQIIKKSIQKWFITGVDYSTPDDLIPFEYCGDKNCYRKESSYKKTSHHFESKIFDNYYSKKDIFWEIDSYETSRLNQLWIILEE